MLNSYIFGSFDGDAANYIKAFSTPPSAARAAIINNFFLALKADTTYSAFDAIYLLGGADSQCTLLNLINPSETLSQVNSNTFTADSGWTGNATSSYLVSSYNINTLAKYSLNSCHASVWSLTNSSNTNYYDCGQDAASNVIRFNTRDTTTPFGNISSTGAMTGTSSDSLGHFIINRTGSTATQIYKNGSSVGTDTDAADSLPTGHFTILAHRSSYSGRKLMAASIGRGLTSGEVTTFYNALNTYKTAIGA